MPMTKIRYIMENDLDFSGAARVWDAAMMCDVRNLIAIIIALFAIWFVLRSVRKFLRGFFQDGILRKLGEHSGPGAETFKVTEEKILSFTIVYRPSGSGTHQHLFSVIQELLSQVRPTSVPGIHQSLVSQIRSSIIIVIVRAGKERSRNLSVTRNISELVDSESCNGSVMGPLHDLFFLQFLPFS